VLAAHIRKTMTVNRRRTVLAVSALLTLAVVGHAPPAAGYNVVKPRFLILLDVSGSMDTSTGGGNNSCGWARTRFNDAKCVLGKLVNSYGDVVFGLARFHQTCSSACNWSGPTCGDNCNTGGSGCISWGLTDNRGEILVPLLEDNQSRILKWVNGTCAGTCTKDDINSDPEPRPNGYTPIAGSLRSIRNYFQGGNQDGFPSPFASDAYWQCRPYRVIVLTDGDETCTLYANTNTAADELHSTAYAATTKDINTYVIGFGVGAGNVHTEAIASAGHTDAPPTGGDHAFYATDETTLSVAFNQIIADSMQYEKCDGIDNNCNNLIDEDWPELTNDCTVGLGLCSTPGKYVCVPISQDPTQTTTCCGTPQSSGSHLGTCLTAPAGNTEICDGIDNNCDGQIDEGWPDKGQACDNGQLGECKRFGVKVCNPANRSGPTCCGDFYTGLCLPTNVAGTAEVCDNKDNDCDGLTDEAPLSDVGQACYTIAGNTGLGYCIAGHTVCNNHVLECQGERGPVAEVCDGVDNNCNGQTDENWPEKSQPCSLGLGDCRQTGTFVCNPGDTTHTCCSANGSTCMTPITGTWEVCDGHDNDCNGQVDEVHRPGGVANMLGTSCYTLAGTAGQGPCKAGTWVCQATGGGGATLVCFGQIGPQPEVCDGIDNDCNGVTDDNLTDNNLPCTSIPGNPGDPPTANAWPCRDGLTACQNHVTVCVGEVGPEPEICDTIDNNCNGQTDEDFPLVGTACENGMVGACYRTGSWVCSNDHLSVVCNAPAGTGSQEVCNGVDDDCNGLTDETDPQLGQPCLTLAGNTGLGECRAGAWVCDPATHALRCAGEVGPQAEKCDGLDNDCDGETDEDFKPPLGNLGLACNNGGVGACWHAGTYVCRADGTVVCDAPPGIPQQEVCNGIDDDCNGATDDNVPGNDGQTPCSTPVGECKPGIKMCVDGHWECSGGTLPTPEVCDGKDNNCNGEIDEHPTVDEGGNCYAATDGTPYPVGCTESGGSWTCAGECKLGTLECQHPGGTATLVCVGAKGPGPELCNGKDDDCDGIPDNNAVCPNPGEVCWEAQCVKPCKNDEFPCEAGLTCFDLGQTPAALCAQPGIDPNCFCISSRCAGKQCPAGSHCDELSGDCVDPCVPSPCQEWETCQNGACYDCNTVGCPTGEKCVGNQCQTDPCAGVVCGPAQFCNATGQCQDLCHQSDCEHCYRCPTDGTAACVPDLCCEKSCSTGQYCDPATGDCRTDPCQAVQCAAGFVCDKVDGKCAADPCRALSCDYCQVCQGDVTVSPPVANCIQDPRPECEGGGVKYISAQGGAGCAAAGGGDAGGGPLAGLLLLLGILVGRRGSRGGRR
jgi:hypothetical protein